jgi:uncharacterized membrane protein HdeD (DUF308 family)
MDRPNPFITLVLALLSIAAWVMAVVSWLHHKDHNALGYFAASTILSQMAVTRVLKYRSIL